MLETWRAVLHLIEEIFSGKVVLGFPETPVYRKPVSGAVKRKSSNRLPFHELNFFEFDIPDPRFSWVRGIFQHVSKSDVKLGCKLYSPSWTLCIEGR